MDILMARAAMPSNMDAALAGLRVLDLSGAYGQYCGKLFADMGADVILVEPPHGSPVRLKGPFFQQVSPPEASIPFFYLNTNKRSIAIDLDTASGRSQLRGLAAAADLLIETDRPGAMAARGLGYEALCEVQPSLVYTSITPFGQSGPYADYRVDDLTLLALGGFLHLGGYPDGPPQAMHGEQSYLAGSLFAAVASLAAVISAESSGRGEYIDVSLQESVVMALENAVQYHDLEAVIRPRASSHRGVAGQLPCKDGYVYLMAGGVSGRKAWLNTVEWLVSEGVEGAAGLGEPRWLDARFRASPEAKRAFLAIFAPFSLGRTKRELFEAAKRRRIPLAPVATPEEVLDNPQLRSREFFVEVPDWRRGGNVMLPGAPYRHSATPWRIAHSAPRLNEHASDILREIEQCTQK